MFVVFYKFNFFYFGENCFLGEGIALYPAASNKYPKLTKSKTSQINIRCTSNKKVIFADVHVLNFYDIFQQRSEINIKIFTNKTGPI